MSTLSRRQALRVFLRGMLGVGGCVVLARVAAPMAEAAVDQAAQDPLLQRADRLAAAAGETGHNADGAEEFCRWINVGFRNGGGFGAGFRNGGGGGFGAFRNGGGGGFGAGFRNGGGFGGGNFRNGGFNNNGFGGGSFRNNSFRNW